jgi:hypothetical protein
MHVNDDAFDADGGGGVNKSGLTSTTLDKTIVMIVILAIILVLMAMPASPLLPLLCAPQRVYIPFFEQPCCNGQETSPSSFPLVQLPPSSATQAGRLQHTRFTARATMLHCRRCVTGSRGQGEGGVSQPRARGATAGDKGLPGHERRRGWAAAAESRAEL